jgi:hypothetical protein
MKKSYEKPAIAKRGQLSKVTAFKAISKELDQP